MVTFTVHPMDGPMFFSVDTPGVVCPWVPRGTCDGPLTGRTHGTTHGSSAHHEKYHDIMAYPTIFHGLYTMEQPTA